MRKSLLILFILGYSTIKAQVGDLIWEDNFETFNTDIWNPISGNGCEIGLCGWGNQELEYYREDNISIEDIVGEANNKALVLEARNETFEGNEFTSGKVDSEGNLSVHYGMIEIRMMTPSVDTGLWPAAWLLGTSNLNWPAKGELDMMEMGQAASERANQGHQNSDIDSYVGANAIFADGSGNQASIAYDTGYNKPYVATTTLANRFVKYRLYWEPTQLRFTIIDNEVEYDLYEAPFPISEDDLTNPFTKPFYFLLNLAVGGNFTDAVANSQVTATLPAKLYIDYVKVYEWNGYGSVQENYADLIPESGAFGVFTENTPVDDRLVIGTDSEIFIWENTFGEGTTEAYDGTQVIAWETSSANNWFGGGILSTDGRDMSSYTENGSLIFDIKIPEDVSFRIGITDNSDTQSWIVFNANEDNYGLTRNGEWGEVTIPIEDFGTAIDYTDLGYMFAILSVDDNVPASKFELGIDDIVWVDGNTGADVTGISVSPSNLVIAENETYQLTASLFPNTATNTNVTWSSVDESIVSIDQNGVITANKEGITTIRVISEDGSYQANSFVTVGEVADTNNGSLDHYSFGVYTDTTEVDDNLTIGDDADLFVWAGFAGGTETAYEGDNVIAWESIPDAGWFGAGILADPSKDMSGYEAKGSLKFNIKIPAGISFRIGVTDDSGGDSYLTFNGNEEQYGLTRDGEWGAVEIPLSEFSSNIDFSEVGYMFVILSVDGQVPTEAFQLGVDNIVWESGEEGTIDDNDDDSLDHYNFGVYTDTAPIDDNLTIGDDSDLFVWAGFVGGTESAYEGDNVIAWESTPATGWFGGGILADPAQDMSGYESKGALTFNIKVPAAISFRIGIIDNSGNESYVNFTGNEDQYGLTRDGEWGVVEIPFSEFSNAIDYSKIGYMFTILSVDGQVPTEAYQLGIDNIVWKSGEEQGSLSTNDFVNDALNISVYPNPFNDILNITSANASTNVETVVIIDMNGKTIKYSNNQDKRAHIEVDTNSLSSGIYFAKITDTSGNITMKKLIKN